MMHVPHFMSCVMRRNAEIKVTSEAEGHDMFRSAREMDDGSQCSSLYDDEKRPEKEDFASCDMCV